MNRPPYIFRLREVVQASGAKIRISERMIESARRPPEELFREWETGPNGLTGEEVEDRLRPPGPDRRGPRHRMDRPRPQPMILPRPVTAARCR